MDKKQTPTIHRIQADLSKIGDICGYMKAVEEMSKAPVDFSFMFDINTIFEKPEPKTVEELMKPIPKKDGDRLPHYRIDVPDDVINWKRREWASLMFAKKKPWNNIDKKLYLSDFLSDLGDNCIFEKETTGCGGTTLALNQEGKNMIIVMPTRSTVDSKEWKRECGLNEKRDDVFCVYKGNHDRLEDFIDYKNYLIARNLKADKHQKMKIVCTYDQLYKIYDWLTGGDGYGNMIDRGRQAINISDWWLYIDEMHGILNAYEAENRRKAINDMLELVNTFKHVVFITATPLKECYFFDQIFKEEGRFKVVEMHFPEWAKQSYSLEKIQTPYVIKGISTRLKEYLSNHIPGNAHVFINSVHLIKLILGRLDYVHYADKIRIVCGQDDDRNANTLKDFICNKIRTAERKGEVVKDWKFLDKLCNDYEKDKTPNKNRNFLRTLGDVNSQTKKINFYTSSAFEGVDLFDNNPKSEIFMVSSSRHTHTFFDISTKFRQITGRIRDYQGSNVVKYYYDKNPYVKWDFDEWEAYYAEKKNTQRNAFNNKKLLDAIIKDNKLEDYYIVRRETKDGQYYYEADRLLEMKDELNYDTLSNRIISSANANTLLDSMGYNVEHKTQHNVDNTYIEEQKPETNKSVGRSTFKDNICKYYEMRDKDSYGHEIVLIKDMEKKHPEYKDIYDLYTLDEVKGMGFRINDAALNARKIEKYKKDIIAHLKLLAVVPGETLRPNKKRSVEAEIKRKHRLTRFKIKDVFNVSTTQKRIDGKNESLTTIVSEL